MSRGGPANDTKTFQRAGTIIQLSPISCAHSMALLWSQLLGHYAYDTRFGSFLADKLTPRCQAIVYCNANTELPQVRYASSKELLECFQHVLLFYFAISRRDTAP